MRALVMDRGKAYAAAARKDEEDVANGMLFDAEVRAAPEIDGDPVLNQSEAESEADLDPALLEFLNNLGLQVVAHLRK